ncbi:MAG TPA: thioredoxin [Caldimonas sp.]|nr:thioredoxin [Caldimonas sp.]
MRPLPTALEARPGGIEIVLFSQADCEFCAEIRDHYLRPLMAERRPAIAVAESRIDADLPIRDWQGRSTTQRLFSAGQGVRFAPTVMFFDASGRSLAPPIVGLSTDFFGSYLDQRIAVALAAARRSDNRP